MGTEDETERLPEGEDAASQDVPAVTDAIEIDDGDLAVEEPVVAAKRGSGWGTTIAALVIALLALGSGLGIGYLLWGEAIHVSGVMPVVQAKPLDPIAAQAGPAVSHAQTQPEAKPTQGPALPPAQYVAQLPESYTLPVSYGNLGPELVKGGAIDLPAFLAMYTDGGKPLSGRRAGNSHQGSDAPIVIDRTNAHFLLNFFWAVGLANRNAILLEGPIQENGADQVDKLRLDRRLDLGLQADHGDLCQPAADQAERRTTAAAAKGRRGCLSTLLRQQHGIP